MWPNNVTKKDLKIQYYKGSGPGGQNKNKRDTACRITHIPTGITATAEDERTQGKNKSLAFKRLADKLVPIMKKIAQPEREKPSEETVRSYHEKRNQVKDHRLDKTYEYDKVLGGEIDPLLRELMKRELK